MVEKLKGFLLIFLVVLLSLVFALQFGGGQAEGCTAGGTTYVARVYGQTLSKGDFEAAYVIGRFNSFPEESQISLNLPQLVLDGLVDRTLLAHEARQLGFSATQEEVMGRLVNDGTVMLSLGMDAPAYLPQGEIPLGLTDKDGNFDQEYAKRYIQNGLKRSIGEFAEAQVDELLAARMKELVASVVTVGDQEVWDAFVEENDRAKIKYIRFSPTFYRDETKSDLSGLDLWMAKNDELLEKEYETNKHRYTGLDAQVRSRHVLIKLEPNADDKAKKNALDKAESVRKKALAGKNFAALAEKYSEDKGTAEKGGDLGFNPRGRMVKSFDDAQFAMEVGDVSEVVESPFGFHVIKVEAKREGDVPKDEAKRELAERLYPEERAKEKARKAAKSWLAKWEASSSENIEKQLEGAQEQKQRSAFAPKMRESQSFGRTDNPIPGLPAEVVIKEVFEIEEAGAFSREPVQAGTEWVIFLVEERTKPDEAAFTGDVKLYRTQALKASKQQEALRLYLGRLRAAAEAAGELRIKGLPTSNPT